MTGLALRVSVPKWNVESELGYKPITTFWEDFSIADKFGNEAVNDTFKRAFTEWKGNYAYLTEMVMVLNHKIWQWYKKNILLAKLYNQLYDMAAEYAVNNLKGEELDYFIVSLTNKGNGEANHLSITKLQNGNKI